MNVGYSVGSDVIEAEEGRLSLGLVVCREERSAAPLPASVLRTTQHWSGKLVNGALRAHHLPSTLQDVLLLHSRTHTLASQVMSLLLFFLLVAHIGALPNIPDNEAQFHMS